MNKVLNTVATCCEDFLKQNPDSIIYAMGSTRSRNRLYRTILSNHLSLLENEYLLLGEIDNQWLKFEKDKDYQSFIILRK